MASGRFDLSKTLGVSQYIYSRCEWSGSGDINSNKTPLYIKVVVGKKSGSNTPTTCTFNTTVSVSGAEYPSSQSSSPYDSISANEEIVVFEGTFVVPHENDGSKSTTISVSIGNNNVYHAEGSATITLDTIKRATELPSFTTLTVEQQTVFTLSPYINNAKHSIKLRCGNTQSSAITNPVTKWVQPNWSLGDSEALLSGNSLAINVPSNLYNVFDGSVGHIAMTLYTYNGSTLIDSKTKWVKLLPGSNCTPVVTATVVDTNLKTIEATGGENNIVANASVIKITPTIQISDVDDKNAWVVSKSVDNISFTETEKIINKPSKNEFLVSVTNNRGLTGSYTAKPTGHYVPYVDLTFNVDDINRTEPTSSEVKIQYSGKFYAGEFTNNLGSNGTFNQLTVTWYYKVKDGSDGFTLGGTLSPKINNNNNTYSGEASLGSLFDYKTNYEFKFEYEDIINTYTKDKVYVTKGEPIFWWNETEVHILGDLYVDDKLIAEGGNGGGTTSARGDTLPVGAIFDYEGDTIPDGYEEVADENVYSTEETRIGTWTDGKPLYRQVVEGKTPTQAGIWADIKALPSNIQIKKATGTLASYLPVPIFVTNDYLVSVQYSGNSIQAYAIGYLDIPISIIVEYTKTTD